MQKRNEIVVFEPNGRRQDYKIRSLIPAQCVEAVKAKLGPKAAKRVQETLEAMEKNGLEFIQLRIDDRRLRVRKIEIA